MPRTIHQLIEKLQQSNPKLRLEVLKELDRRCHGSSDVQSEVARYGGLDEMWRELRRATRAVENKLCALKIISHFSTHAQLRDVLIQPETLRELEKSLQHPSDQIKAAVLQVYADLSFRNEQSQALLIETGLATTLLSSAWLCSFRKDRSA